MQWCSHQEAGEQRDKLASRKHICILLETNPVTCVTIRVEEKGSTPTTPLCSESSKAKWFVRKLSLSCTIYSHISDSPRWSLTYCLDITILRKCDPGPSPSPQSQLSYKTKGVEHMCAINNTRLTLEVYHSLNRSNTSSNHTYHYVVQVFWFILPSSYGQYKLSSTKIGVNRSLGAWTLSSYRYSLQ